MHPHVYAAFEGICRSRAAGGDVLEIGAMPAPDTLLLLPALRQARRRVGLNLDGPHRFEGLEILQGNANDLACFRDGEFDTVLCNATLEHDPCFWKTLGEIRRVLKTGGLAVLGVPGYDHPPHPFGRRLLKRLGLGALFADTLAGTPTLVLHHYPGDYYRFSAQALREVFFAGYREVDVRVLMNPPRLVGSGLKAG